MAAGALLSPSDGLGCAGGVRNSGGWPFLIIAGTNGPGAAKKPLRPIEAQR